MSDKRPAQPDTTTYLFPTSSFSPSTLSKIRHAESITTYRFSDRDLLHEALLPASPTLPASGTNLKGGPLSEGNRGLALIGDAVLFLVLRSRCYGDGKSVSQAHDWTVRRVCNKALAELAREKGLEACLLRTYEESDWVYGRWGKGVKTLATLVEAVVGAAYLDGGIEAAERVVEGLDMLEESPSWVYY